MNHYETIKQIKVLKVREALDVLYFNVLVLGFSYKNYHMVEQCVREAQATLAYDLDKFNPMSSDIHNILAGLLNIKPSNDEEEVLMNSTNLNIKKFVTFIRRIANKQAYNEQMDYYLKELQNSLVIRDEGLKGMCTLIIMYDDLEFEYKQSLVKGIIGHGMEYARNNYLVRSYIPLLQEMNDEEEERELDRKAEELKQSIIDNAQESYDIQMGILQTLQAEREDRLQEKQEAEEEAEEEAIRQAEIDKQQRLEDAKRQFTMLEYAGIGLAGWAMNKSSKNKHNGESGSNPSTKMFNDVVDKYKGTW